MLSLMVCLLLQIPKAEAEAEAVRNPDLRAELQARVKEDQAARFALIELMGKHPEPTDAEVARELQSLLERVREADEKNTAWLKKIVRDRGWPGKSLVGESAAHDAWLLVQHADHDLEFQDDCLAKMRALPDGEVRRQDVAYLTDRVRVGRGEKQVYGTQARLEDGQAVPFPIDDEANVDQRRKEAGLGPLAAYLKQLEAVYKKP